MSGALVIGVGSDLRRDDAVGRHVAEEYEARSLGDVAVIVTTQLVPELVEPISASDRVVFVDASVAVSAVAAVLVEPLAGAGDSHHSTPGALLGLAERLGMNVPPAFLVQVPAHDLSLGEGLSPQTAGFVPTALAMVGDLADGGDVEAQGFESPC